MHSRSIVLGTITSTGADVYSYDEDDMVEDPNLAIHLSHWGINMMKMEKTDRSMADLEIELNQKFGEASMIEEANSKLTPVYGAGKENASSRVLPSIFNVPFRLHGNKESRQFLLFELGDASSLHDQRFSR